MVSLAFPSTTWQSLLGVQLLMQENIIINSAKPVQIFPVETEAKHGKGLEVSSLALVQLSITSTGLLYCH